MPIPINSSGLAVWCDSTGHLLEVLQDVRKITAEMTIGQPIRKICDPMSRRKCDQLILAIIDKRSVYNWNLNITVDGKIEMFHFAGGLSDDKVLLIGTENLTMTDRLYEELVRINSDQANALRTALKELATKKTEQVIIPDNEVNDINLNDFTNLNNELVNLQRQLSKRNQELDSLNEQKNQFIGMAAHDLRNPLGVISGFAKILNTGVMGELTEEQLKMTTKIQQSSDFMLRLVNDLLDVSNIEAGKLELRIEAVDIQELISETISMHENHANTKQISLHIEIKDNVPKQLSLDKDKMEQVISNLVSNAIKYSPSDTTIEIILRREGQNVFIEVVDQGQGIPEQEQKTLFQPFQKTSVQSTAGEKSTGLGLAIVQRIVEGHGGEISVSSLPGEGSTFRVRIPLK